MSAMVSGSTLSPPPFGKRFGSVEGRELTCLKLQFLDLPVSRYEAQKIKFTHPVFWLIHRSSHLRLDSGGG